MKCELLIPVGDYESLEYAIAGGADAVYLGVKNFNARAYAKNFSLEEIEKAVKLCHLYGVKIYITMNTLVKEKEVSDFLETVSFLHKIGVDALIMQDFGMICLVRETFPNLEIHASTQANLCTREAIELFYEMGVKRVVLPREMSLSDIEKIDVPIEKEVFIHGALCMSYSGCCLMSSMIGTRSANRGECTGCCRLPYTLYRGRDKLKEGYLLSTKELNTSSRIEDLLNSSITSFKVEGRMKSPFYVGFITRFYRRLIDREKFDYEEELDKLKILFNRDFTLGHLFNEDIRNPQSPNHLGLKIGKVIQVTAKKIKIRLSYPLYQEDGLRFQNSNLGFVANFIYDTSGKLISSAFPGDVIELDNKISLKSCDDVYKTTSKKMYADILKLSDRKIDVSMHLKALCGKRLTLTVSDGEEEIVVFASCVEKAKNAPISRERIEKQLQKLGNTPFSCSRPTVEMSDSIFISIQELNALRREALEKLKKVREERKVEFQKEEVHFPKIIVPVEKEISVQVETEEQLKAVQSSSIGSIYIPKRLSSKYLDSRFVGMEDFSHQDFSTLCLRKFYRKPKNDISDYTFNVVNIYTVYYLLKLGYKKVTLSVELSNEEIFFLFTHFKEVFHFTPSVEVIVYDRVVVMNIAGNILELSENDFSYYLKDGKERCFPVIYQDGFTYIYNYEVRKRDTKLFFSLPLSFRYCYLLEDATDMLHFVNR